MSTSFLNSYRKGSTEKLQAALAASQNKFKRDERYWQLEVDKAGNGFAIIRFLDRPPCDGDEGVAFVSFHEHSFQGPGGWYIEKSLTSIDKDDPVNEYNSKLWATGVEENQNIARRQKRKQQFVGNILVVKDPAHPENEGKVFLFKFGKKIYDKIFAKQNPRKGDLDSETGNQIEPVNVVDIVEGSNFTLRARKEKGFRNYDESEFSKTLTPIAKKEADIERLINSAYSLKAEVDPATQFKTYAELKKRLDRVLAYADAQTAGSAEKAHVETEVPAAASKAVEEALGTALNDPDLQSFRDLVADDDE